MEWVLKRRASVARRAGGPGAPGRQSPREPHWDPGWAAQLEEQMVCDLAELSLTVTWLTYCSPGCVVFGWIFYFPGWRESPGMGEYSEYV